MESNEITPVILTYNEAPNIGRSLERLTWASRVVVVDSGSDDETASICDQYPNTELIVRAFDDHSLQWNFGIDQVATEWVLALDADYLVAEGFANEIEGMDLEESVSGLLADFRYLVFGKALRGCLYPSKVVLFRKERCQYV
ncbi:MAG: glycosyltransferase [Verrucomicrobiota bacterium]